MAMLNEIGGRLGGETSGHLLCLDKTTTGDGLVSALQVLVVMIETGLTLAELAGGMPRFPQTLINIRTESSIDLDASVEIQNAIRSAEQKIADRGRILVRASGTEPVVRVMVEGEDEGEVSRLAEELAEEISRSAA
jgi:phosphoglucosamine mutase